MNESVGSISPHDISVVIATLGRSDELLRTLESVGRCAPPPGEVVVVDGDPSDAMRDEISGLGLGTEVRYETAPRGLTIQRNHGAEKAAGRVVAYLDDDVRVPPDTFARLAGAYGDTAVIGVTGAIREPGEGRIGGKYSLLKKLLPGGGKEGSFTRFGYPRRLIDTEREQDVEFMSGCFMTARTEEVRRLRFDEALAGYALAEDEDFSYRLSRVGRIRFLPGLVVEHKNLGFRTRDQRVFNRQVVVNRAYLFRKNFRQSPVARLQFWLFVGMLFVHRILNREWSGVRGLADGVAAAWRNHGSSGP